MGRDAMKDDGNVEEPHGNTGEHDADAGEHHGNDAKPNKQECGT